MCLNIVKNDCRSTPLWHETRVVCHLKRGRSRLRFVLVGLAAKRLWNAIYSSREGEGTVEGNPSHARGERSEVLPLPSHDDIKHRTQGARSLR